MTHTLTEFATAAPTRYAVRNGNTAWAQRYANEMRKIITEIAMASPRNLQRHLGPSELGVECDRQVVAKLLDLPPTNHVMDPWPSIVGTAVHAWLAEALEQYNERIDTNRFIPENRVTPMDGHSGTADVYDIIERAVVDWKCLGQTTLDHLRLSGPPRKYLAQLLLYALGYRNIGVDVDRVVLFALPRTKSTLDELYVWERPASPADDVVLLQVFEDTARRKVLADAVTKNQLRLTDIPAIPDDSECIFCPIYRPQSAHDNGPGCPGIAAHQNGVAP